MTAGGKGGSGCDWDVLENFNRKAHRNGVGKRAAGAVWKLGVVDAGAALLHLYCIYYAPICNANVM